MPADPPPAERREWAEGLLQGTTPGPWFAEDDLNHAYTPPVVEHWIVAKTDADLLDDLVCEVENAKDSALLAAAPDLAAAVRDLADENAALREQVERLREALQGVLDDIRLDPEDEAPIASRISLAVARAALTEEPQS